MKKDQKGANNQLNYCMLNISLYNLIYAYIDAEIE